MSVCAGTFLSPPGPCRDGTLEACRAVALVGDACLLLAPVAFTFLVDRAERQWQQQSAHNLV